MQIAVTDRALRIPKRSFLFWKVSVKQFTTLLMFFVLYGYVPDPPPSKLTPRSTDSTQSTDFRTGNRSVNLDHFKYYEAPDSPPGCTVLGQCPKYSLHDSSATSIGENYASMMIHRFVVGGANDCIDKRAERWLSRKRESVPTFSHQTNRTMFISFVLHL